MHNRHPIKRYRRFLLLLGALLLVCACQGSPSTTPLDGATAAPAAAPTVAGPAPTPAPAQTSAPPTSAPQPATAPASTAAPQPAALLPAPVYLLDEGQIWRMERDGRARRQLTFETAPIVDFDLGSADNALVYLIGEGSEHTIVLLDESGRTEMMRGPVWGPRISPSGDQIAFQLEQPVDGLQIGREKGSDIGVWAIPRTGGRPGVLQANDPIPDPNSPPDDARLFYPKAWSPDGTQLLMGVYFPVGDGGLLAVKHMADGTVVEIGVCCEAAWTADSSSLIVAGGTLVQDATLGLWRADPRTGKTTDLIPGMAENGFPLVTAARQLGDGNVYAFLAVVKEPSLEGRDKLRPVRIEGDSVPNLRKESYLLAGAVWAEDASGALIADASANPADSSGALSWLPLDGGPAVALAGRGSSLRWGNASPRPSPDACGRYHVIAWDPPQSRAARPEVLDVQRRLLALGYTQVGAADGLFGDQTREAVRAFQQAAGLPASGEVDCATWGALLKG